MQERERVIITGLIVLMLVLWLGFAVHRSPRFAGSLAGGILGVSGAVLMLIPLAYAVVKRTRPRKMTGTQGISMRTLLAWHIYAGILGPLLGLLHTGHKFQSPLGIMLTAMMLIVVLSGFIGRYLLNQTSQEVRQKREILSRLQAEYDEVAAELSRRPEPALAAAARGFFPSLRANLLVTAPAGGTMPVAERAIRIAQSIADVDYAVKTHETFRRAFRLWLKLHIVLAVTLYVLLGLHVWSGIYFGLRWFE
jgi:hypothetical protein